MNDQNNENKFPTIVEVLVVILATIGLTFFIGIIGVLVGARKSLFLLESLIILPALVFVIVKKMPLKKVFRIHPVKKELLVVSAFIGIALTIIIDEFDRLIQTIIPMPEFLIEAMEESLKIQSPSDLVIILFSAVLLASVLEEMLFRGFLQVSLEQRLDVTRAVMSSAIIFAIVHMNPWWTIQFTLFGIILGVMAWKSRSIIPAIVVHFINNGTALIFNNMEKENYQWYLYKGHVSIPILVGSIIILFYGMKVFYYFCEITQKEKKIDVTENEPQS